MLLRKVCIQVVLITGKIDSLIDFLEEVLIVKHVGYQITSKSLFGKSTEFIPYERVQTVFINEVILRVSLFYSLMWSVKQLSCSIE